MKSNEYNNSMENAKKVIVKTGKSLVFSSVWMFLLIMFSITSCYTIKTGEVGVVTRFGKVQGVSNNGIHYKIPIIDRVIKIETRDMIMTDSYEVSSKDMQTVTTKVSVQYRIIDPLSIFTRFRDEYGARLVEPRIAETVQATTSRYTIEELVSKRQLLSLDIFNLLKEDLKPFGIQVIKISIIDHDFSDQFEKAIESKKVSEQEAQAREIQNIQALKNAENNLKVKQVEAQANAVLTQSLTQGVLKKMYIEKWDGKLPQVQGSDSVIMNMEK